MPNALQQAGAGSEPTNFAPLHTNRIFTGLWTNRSFLRDAATSDYQERYGMSRQDSILDGFNSEISPRLTLKRRAGSGVYNNAGIIVNRFYSFNTFNLTDEFIRVMADTNADVRDVTLEQDGTQTNKVIFTKSAAAQDGKHPTFFLGVGNTLYFTNGVDNKQVSYDPSTKTWGTVSEWGIDAPTVAPTVTQSVRSNPYPSWPASTVVYSSVLGNLYVKDPNGNMQQMITGGTGTTGPGEPSWKTSGGIPPAGHTTDGQLTWNWVGPHAWQANFGYSAGVSAITAMVNTPLGTQEMTFQATSTPGQSGVTPPNWPSGVGSTVKDNGVTWTNIGLTLNWDTNIGANQVVSGITQILDPNGYLQQVFQAGKTGPTAPKFSTVAGDRTTDNGAVWQTLQAFAPAETAPVQYGYEYADSALVNLSNMSPKSIQIVRQLNNEITVQGPGTGAANVGKVVVFRTAQGGSTFLYLTTLDNPGAGNTWTFVDHSADADLNTEWQAQVGGEGTPLPSGATCLGYHLGRIFAAVGNVVWISSGPDAVVGGSSGNAGFDTTFTAQSKITRFWTCPLGMVVFTVRDAYIILGSATDSDPLYMVVFIEDLPLRSYDCFSVNKTTPFILQGNNTLISLDPSAGIVEVGFPIADVLLSEFDSAKSFVTFHKESSLDTALYVANGIDHWYRMAATNAPESGSSWSPRANFATLGCVQSVEVNPGQYRLLMSGTSPGPILQRDRTKNTDNTVPFAAMTRFGAIVLALPGQLAALTFITLESVRLGTRPTLALLLGELSGTFEVLNRTRQDPPNLPPSNTIFSDRYHFEQNQKTAWCRHFQMEISWPAEDAANELLTFTIFGQTWQEMRAQ